MTSLPPGLVLIIGGLLVPLVQGRARAALTSAGYLSDDTRERPGVGYVDLDPLDVRVVGNSGFVLGSARDGVEVETLPSRSQKAATDDAGSPGHEQRGKRVGHP